MTRAGPCSVGRDGARPRPTRDRPDRDGLVSAAVESGELPELDPEAPALVLIGALIEAAMQIAVAEDRAAARQRSETVIIEMLEGLRR